MTFYIDFGIGPDGDIAYENGKMKLVKRDDEIVQRVRTRLKRILGEWFLNIDAGMPYFNGRMLGSNDYNYTRLKINSEILSTEGVNEVKKINIINDPETKKTSVYAEIVIDNTIYKIKEEL